MQHAPRTLFPLLLSICVLLPSAVAAGSADQGGAKVVYHIDDTARAIPAIRNINNHLKAAPDTKIVVVALGHGIDFMLDGAKDDRGNPFEPMIDDLSFAGVSFRICGNTLEGRQIDADQVHPEVEPVQSGVAEIARLQQTEHYAYIKP
ncbi:DsrE family protein [Panacagrimonas sp.]|uniref:DsrE family protein n=1 Tax=Panacagrimonas sp. TaxID=2480088 RepID=UPI003B528798